MQTPWIVKFITTSAMPDHPYFAIYSEESFERVCTNIHKYSTAAVLAAAPDLVDALKAAIRTIPPKHYAQPAYELAIKALVKAEAISSAPSTPTSLSC